MYCIKNIIFTLLLVVCPVSSLFSGADDYLIDGLRNNINQIERLVAQVRQAREQAKEQKTIPQDAPDLLFERGLGFPVLSLLASTAARFVQIDSSKFQEESSKVDFSSLRRDFRVLSEDILSSMKGEHKLDQDKNPKTYFTGRADSNFEYYHAGLQGMLNSLVRMNGLEKEEDVLKILTELPGTVQDTETMKQFAKRIVELPEETRREPLNEYIEKTAKTSVLEHFLETQLRINHVKGYEVEKGRKPDWYVKHVETQSDAMEKEMNLTQPQKLMINRLLFPELVAGHWKPIEKEPLWYQRRDVQVVGALAVLGAATWLASRSEWFRYKILRESLKDFEIRNLAQQHLNATPEALNKALRKYKSTDQKKIRTLIKQIKGAG